MMKAVKHPWYRNRPYRHFDDPVPRFVAEALATDPGRVASHSFYPFLSLNISEPRYKRDTRKVEYKDRRIAYAAHKDAAIFSYYSHLLAPLYETFLGTNNISSAIIGYRRLGKSNIDFAAEVFDLIRHRRKPSVAIGLDIDGFFDNISHSVLKSNISELLGGGALPEDHYKVFRAMTAWSWVSKDEAYTALSIPINTSGVARLCAASEYRKKIRENNLINKNSKNFGIPQGSPISALYSNIAMMRFDVAVHSFVYSLGGIYRRYSDDICIVVDVADRDRVMKFVELHLGPMNLKIKSKKTEISEFYFLGGRLRSGKPFQYLGFTFDGASALVREKSLSRYWRRLLKAAKFAKRSARIGARQGGYPQIFKRKMINRFSHLGSHNFIKYAQRSAVLHSAPKINAQVARHWKKLMDEIS